jgi:hypothetical protein
VDNFPGYWIQCHSWVVDVWCSTIHFGFRIGSFVFQSKFLIFHCEKWKVFLCPVCHPLHGHNSAMTVLYQAQTFVAEEAGICFLLHNTFPQLFIINLWRNKDNAGLVNQIEWPLLKYGANSVVTSDHDTPLYQNLVQFNIQGDRKVMHITLSNYILLV